MSDTPDDDDPPPSAPPDLTHGLYGTPTPDATPGDERMDTAVNDQILDAIVEVEAAVSDAETIIAFQGLDAVFAQAAGLAALNAAQAQQSDYMIGNAAMTRVIRRIGAGEAVLRQPPSTTSET